ncbi:MAG: hypothetical protein ACYCR5_04575 [Leptospirillum sp.]
MSLHMHQEIPIVGSSAPKCVFQAKTPKGYVCVIAPHIAEAADVLHTKGFEVGMISAVGELVE